MPPASSALATTSTALVVANGDPPVPAPEEDIDLPLDLSQLPMIPMQKTLLLVNNFVANTTRFLNHFAHECEERIARVSTNLTRVEIMLAILEAKLDSIPDLTVTESDIAAVDGDASPATATPGIQIDMDELPATEPEQGFVPPPPPPPPADYGGDFADGAPPPPPPPPPPQPGMDGALVVAPLNGLDAPSSEPASAPAPAFMKLKDDPLYAKYFTMQRLGMPQGAVIQKMFMDEVDPGILSMDPEGPTPSGASPPTALQSDQPPLPIAASPGPLPPTLPLMNLARQSSVESTGLPPPPPPPSLPPFSPTSSTSSRGHPESLFGDGPPPPPPPQGNPPLPPQSDDDDSSSDDDDMPPPAGDVGGFLKLKDDPAYAKYFNMQKMGLPEGAIRQKLLMDGVTVDILSMDPEGPSPSVGSSTTPPSAASQPGGLALPPPPLPTMPPALPPAGARPALPPPPIRRYDDSDSDSDF